MMKKICLIGIAFAMCNIIYSQTIFINEIHFDNSGSDINEGVEIAGLSGTDLSGFKVRFYNQAGSTYGTILNLTGIIPNQLNGHGTLWFPYANIQNGPSDALVLIDDIGNVIQFLSYGGVTSGVEGEANGITSTDIGKTEDNSTPINFSIQLIGQGVDYGDFSWEGPINHTRGLPNTGQTLSVFKNEIDGFKMYPNPTINGKLYVTSNSTAKKDVEIYSLNGQKVFKKRTLSNEVMNISHLSKGLFIVKIIEERKISTRKLVIE